MVNGMAVSVRFEKLSAPLNEQPNLFANIDAYNDYLDFFSRAIGREPRAPDGIHLSRAVLYGNHIISS